MQLHVGMLWILQCNSIIEIETQITNIIHMLQQRLLIYHKLLQPPLQDGKATPIPGNVLSTVNNVDFGNQFVIYAHLGTTAAQGYGIGISRVVQTGNDRTVTVRSISSHPNTALSLTKSDDFVRLYRATLNVATPINVTFVDQNGTV